MTVRRPDRPGAAGPARSHDDVAYVSSRDSEHSSPVSFERALIAGLAPDGGLYLPQRLPPADEAWRGAPDVGSLAGTLLSGLTGYDADELRALMRRALDFEFPVVALSDDRFVLELFHGPTAAFKDVGARAMARLMDAALRRMNRRATVLVATSGDTGSAVADAFAGAENLSVALLYPAGKVSSVQEKQLIARRKGVRAFAVAGTFDDCQRLVKGAFADPALSSLGLTTANSINVGRLLPQIVYYFWAVDRLAREHRVEEPFQVVVPSGNLGNLTAAMLAQDMGLTYAGLNAAHNANDYFVRFLQRAAGAFEFAPSVPTVSNAMDVGAPSNFERLQALYAGSLGERLGSCSVDDEATMTRMRLTYEADGYLACPHTAVALEALERLRAAPPERGADRRRPLLGPALVLATAHPAKFPAAVEEAIGEPPPPHAGLAAILDADTRVETLAAEQSALRAALLEGA